MKEKGKKKCLFKLTMYGCTYEQFIEHVHQDRFPMQVHYIRGRLEILFIQLVLEQVLYEGPEQCE